MAKKGSALCAIKLNTFRYITCSQMDMFSGQNIMVKSKVLQCPKNYGKYTLYTKDKNGPVQDICETDHVIFDYLPLCAEPHFVFWWMS